MNFNMFYNWALFLTPLIIICLGGEIERTNKQEDLNVHWDHTSYGNTKIMIKYMMIMRPQCMSDLKPTACKVKMSRVFELKVEGNQICWNLWTCDDLYTTDQCDCVHNEDDQFGYSMMDFGCQPIDGDLVDILEVEMNDLDVCEIGGMKLTHCSNTMEKTESMFWISQTQGVFFLPNLGIRKWFDPLDRNSYNCELENGTSCNCDICDGDDMYCKSFTCLHGSCKCKAVHNRGKVMYTNGVNSFSIGCWGIGDFLVKRKFNMRSGFKKYDCSVCETSCVGGSIMVNTHGLIPVFAKFCLAEHCISQTIHDTPFTMELTRDMALIGGSSSVLLWIPDKHTVTSVPAYCKPMSICEYVRCHFCWERWENPQCYGAIETTTIMFMFFTSLILWLVIFKTCYWVIKSRILKLPLIILRSTVFKIVPKFKWNWRNRGDDMNLPSTVQDVIPEVTTPRTPRYRKSMLLMSILLIVGSQACSDTDSIQIAAPSCKYSDTGVETCSVDSTTRLTIAPVGQVSCFMIKDPTSKIIGSIIIKTNSIDLKCKRRILYYSPVAESKCLWYHECRSVGDCWGTKCEEYPSDGSYKMSKDSEKRLGWSRCSRVCGCAGCGCGFCSDACLWYRSFLTNPREDYVEVSECSQWEYEINLEVSKQTVSNTQISKIKMSPGVSQTQYGIKFTLISVSVPPQPILNGCIIKYYDKFAITSCNREDQITAGVIGEIQCPTSTSAINIDKYCKALPTVIETHPQESSVSCRQNFLDIPNSIKDNYLPLEMEGFRLLQHENQVYAEVNSIGLFEIQLKASKLTLIARTSLNKCFVSVKSLVGCYSCQTGAVLTFIGNTNDGYATGIIKCPQIGVMFPLALNSKPSVYNHTIRVNYGKINTKCVVDCPAGESEFSLEGDLDFLVPKLYLSNDTVVGVQVSSETLAFHWTNLFDMPWTKALWGIFGSALVGIALLMIIISISKRVIKRIV